MTEDASTRPVVTRCICFDVSFETLRDAARVDDLSFDDLQARYHCGQGCGLCVPYIRTMLRTGRTHIPLDEGMHEPPSSSI